MRWLVFFLALLLGLPAWADMYPDASNAKLPQARANIGVTSGCDPVADFGADPTGVQDATAAINQCAAQLINGKHSNIALPAGTYRVNGQINVTTGQSLVGAGRATTVIKVDQAFDPSALGVIVLSWGGMDTGPEVRDIGISFAQPSTQGSRAAFQNLGTCTSGSGGTGCKYPPAILLDGARPKVRNVRVDRAWKGIVGRGAGWIETVEMSALDTGLDIAEVYDWSHYRGYHFWPFDIITGTNLYNGVLLDGQTIAAKFGNVNGANINDFVSLHGRVIFDGAAFWGDINNMGLDSTGARLEIGKNAFPGVRFNNLYTTGAPGPGGACKVSVGAGNQSVQFVNSFFDGVETDPLLCVADGDVLVTGSAFLSNTPSQKAVVTTGGWTFLKANKFTANTAAGAWANPLVDAAGALTAVGNSFPTFGTNAGSIRIAADSANHYVADNNTNVWPVTFGFSFASQVLGYYDLGSQPFHIGTGISAAFDTPGDSVLTRVGSGGIYYMRGDFVEGGADLTFDSNAYTTASGALRVKVTAIPPPLTGHGFGCVTNLVANLTLSSAPTCSADPLGFYFAKTNSAASPTAISTGEAPPGRNGMGVRLSWRYRVR